MQSIFIIINTRAGTKKAERMAHVVFQTLQEQFIKFEHAFTERRGHATELARKAAEKGFDMVVAMGGDGTVNEVVTGIIGSDSTLGIIPTGSGNGLARELKISMNLKKATKNLFRGEEHAIDIWRMNDRYFVCAAGMGFDGHISEKMANSLERGLTGYMKLVLSEGFKYKPQQVSLTVGKHAIEEKMLVVSFANAGQYGNNAIISPGAKTDDGLLDVITIKPIPKMLYPLAGLALFVKMVHRFRFYERIRTDSVNIRESSTSLFHVDGEPVRMQFPVKISLVNHQVRVKVPVTR